MMRISIVVDDGMVYINGKVAHIPLDGLSANGIHAVQWQERELGVGYIEKKFSGENVVIDTKEFEVQFGDLVISAQKMIAAEEARQAVLLAEEEELASSLSVLIDEVASS
jgi:hypothetical protein|tara:strand:+ start:205 stop:534 length:330 start_codon:yes stop_codon:yes gene_type:complete